MKTVAFVSRKGGTGKTTLLANVAWAASRRGYRCLAADVNAT